MSFESTLKNFNIGPPMTKQAARELLAAVQNKYVSAEHPDVARACAVLRRHIATKQFPSASNPGTMLKVQSVVQRTKH